MKDKYNFQNSSDFYNWNQKAVIKAGIKYTDFLKKILNNYGN